MNEALTCIDFLLSGAVEALASTPPVSPAPGQCWIVGMSPGGSWAGHSNEVAGWTEAGWRFLAPVAGMSLFDKATGTFRHYNGSWQLFSGPALPAGGTIIDSQARTVIGQLVAVLANAGIFTAP